MSSEPEHKPVPYEEFTPEGWEKAVAEMLWEEVRKNVFRKVGYCPRCDGEFTFEVVMGFPLAPVDSAQYRCECAFEHPHSNGKRGCGAWGNVPEPEIR